MDRLKNKVAVVTGAAGGIGAAIAKLFAQEGARVIATDVQEEKLKGWVEEEKAGGLVLDYMLLDVTSETGWRTVVDATLFKYNSLDVLVNNAGVYPGFVSCEGTSKALWESYCNQFNRAIPGLQSLHTAYAAFRRWRYC